MSLESDIRARLSSIRDKVAVAAGRARRDPSSITLVAVSKTFGFDAVRAAAAAGQVDFGENRVQEAVDKIERAAELPLRWHLIGHLQSNKARKAAAAFAFIHSIDSADLLHLVDRGAAESGTRPDVLVQADLAGEATKHGARPTELEAIFDAARKCQAARVVGLMVLPPFLDDPEAVRPYFRQLRAIREDLLCKGVAPESLAHLSMGMSHDFEVAIEEGATMVRVGTAIFGERARMR